MARLELVVQRRSTLMILRDRDVPLVVAGMCRRFLQLIDHELRELGDDDAPSDADAS